MFLLYHLGGTLVRNCVRFLSCITCGHKDSGFKQSTFINLLFLWIGRRRMGWPSLFSLGRHLIKVQAEAALSPDRQDSHTSHQNCWQNSVPCGPRATCMQAQSLRVRLSVRLCMTPWTVAHQAPLSMGFSRQKYWDRLPFPPPGGLPDPETELTSPAGRFFPTEPPGKAK